MSTRQVTLTPRQTEVYAFVREQIVRSHLPPTLLEICQHFGWVNQWAAADHLKALERKGLIVRSPGVFSEPDAPEDLNHTGIGTLDPTTDPTRHEFSTLFEEPEHFAVVAGDNSLHDSHAINAGDHCIISRNKKPAIGAIVAIDKGSLGVSLQQYTKGLKIAGTLAGVIRKL